MSSDTRESRLYSFRDERRLCSFIANSQPMLKGHKNQYTYIEGDKNS